MLLKDLFHQEEYMRRLADTDKIIAHLQHQYKSQGVAFLIFYRYHDVTTNIHCFDLFCRRAPPFTLIICGSSKASPRQGRENPRQPYLPYGTAQEWYGAIESQQFTSRTRSPPVNELCLD